MKKTKLVWGIVLLAIGVIGFGSAAGAVGTGKFCEYCGKPL